MKGSPQDSRTGVPRGLGSSVAVEWQHHNTQQNVLRPQLSDGSGRGGKADECRLYICDELLRGAELLATCRAGAKMSVCSETLGIVESMEDVIFNCIFVQVIQGNESIPG
jgi:hypothetical protein